MKRIKTLFLRALLLNKRLLKKPSFILILCLIPVLTLAMVFFAKDESGILTITLCTEDNGDKLANTVINELLEDDGVLHFVKSDSVDEAYDSVKYGKADAAWIFAKDLQGNIEHFASVRNEPFVTVVERETDISLQLSHEKLCGVVYPYISRAIFRNYMLTEVFEENEISAEELDKGYEDAIGGGALIKLEKIDGSDTVTKSNYLTAPLRGILSLVVVLCGLAAVMYHQSDRENKVYDWLSPTKQIFPGIATTGAAVLDSTVIIVAALGISGLFLSPIWEILAAISYIFAVTAFCTLVGCLTKRSSRTGQLIPFIMIIGLVVSPIFFNFVSLKPIQMLLPLYYYLYAVYQPINIIYMLGYSAVVFGISLLINKLTEK